ncbi:hypothetical protein [Paractinoplanes globisporus]|uniref:Uncharacterized protein n=1 Tax=Paractinoplanes globisporus TaxID=113565 RepID=A0ABW6WRB0_9ACTN|nr:hypothetical protein [Actinoplanes globisporus]
MTLDKMQELIQNPSTDAQWDLVGGWQKSAELLSEHRFQVQEYRDNLAAAWPPEKSPASATYLARLDELIKNLSDTYEASITNHEAISAATGSIYQAQVQMNKIYAEYQSNKTALDAFTAKKDQAQSSSTPTPTPSPSGEEPPVAPGRQEELRVQAARLLSTVSTDLAQAQARIIKPTPYTAATERDEKKTIREGDTYVPPLLPPITPSFPDGGGTTTTSRHTATTFPTSPQTTVGVPVTSPSAGTQPGLVLGGAQPTLPPPTSPGFSPTTPTVPTGGGPLPNPGLLPPNTGLLPGGTSPLTPTTPGVGRGLGAPSEGLLRSGGRIPEGGMRTMAPGGIIGGMPGGALGQQSAGRAGMRRINPVGGVIGESEGTLGSQRGAGTGGVSAGQHSTGMYGQGAGRRAGRRDETDGVHWDPDNPWETAEGVDPVVLPSQIRRIDPGPAIGLG